MSSEYSYIYSCGSDLSLENITNQKAGEPLLHGCLCNLEKEREQMLPVDSSLHYCFLPCLTSQQSRVFSADPCLWNQQIYTDQFCQVGVGNRRIERVWDQRWGLRNTGKHPVPYQLQLMGKAGVTP